MAGPSSCLRAQQLSAVTPPACAPSTTSVTVRPSVSLSREPSWAPMQATGGASSAAGSQSQQSKVCLAAEGPKMPRFRVRQRPAEKKRLKWSTPTPSRRPVASGAHASPITLFGPAAHLERSSPSPALNTCTVLKPSSSVAQASSKPSGEKATAVTAPGSRPSHSGTSFRVTLPVRESESATNGSGPCCPVATTSPWGLMARQVTNPVCTATTRCEGTGACTGVSSSSSGSIPLFSTTHRAPAGYTSSPSKLYRTAPRVPCREAP
mmetsp:Transcript_10089/g.23264  ORF Transcript_10089/g.23264 Transcript_10089/m.23264 type:complete len:265 (+) Transcript_10089:521-1315(+)